MKHLINYIQEKLKIDRNIKVSQYNYHPKTREELKLEILKKIIDKETNYNDIDISNIDDLSYLFEDQDITSIDISEWDVSNVTNMRAMFQNCKYLRNTGDLSQWDVSNVNDMSFMFNGCKCLINVGDLSQWDVNGIKMKCMFQNCTRLRDIGNLCNWKPKEANWDIFPHSSILNSALPKNKI